MGQISIYRVKIVHELNVLLKCNFQVLKTSKSFKLKQLWNIISIARKKRKKEWKKEEKWQMLVIDDVSYGKSVYALLCLRQFYMNIV